MTASNIFWNLLLLLPLSLFFCSWILLLLKEKKGISFGIALFFFMLCAVPLGGYLAGMVAVSFNVEFHMKAVNWIEEPIKALKILSASSLVGITFSLGLISVLSRFYKIIGKRPGSQIIKRARN